MSQLSLFNAVPAGAIEVILDEKNQPWFKRRHVGIYLEMKHIDTTTRKLKGEQNKTDIFLSVYGVTHIIINSRKTKGKSCKIGSSVKSFHVALKS